MSSEERYVSWLRLPSQNTITRGLRQQKVIFLQLEAESPRSRVSGDGSFLGLKKAAFHYVLTGFFLWAFAKTTDLFLFLVALLFLIRTPVLSERGSTLMTHLTFITVVEALL